MNFVKQLWFFSYYTELHRENTEMHRELLTEKIIGAAIEVHKTLGPGLLDSAYKECLFFELKTQG